MTIYFPSQKIPLNIKLEQLPSDALCELKGFERSRFINEVCQFFHVSSVVNHGNGDVSVIMANDNDIERTVNILYKFDQAAYCKSGYSA